MKSSGIGGQAVIEGVMMKNKDKYAIAVRKPDNQIEVKINEYVSLGERYKICNVPIIRGVIAFIESLVIGTKTLTYSASFYEEEDEKKPAETSAETSSDKESEKKNPVKENLIMGGTVALSVVLAVGIFILVPYFLSNFLTKYIESAALLTLIEGVIRLVLFIGYVLAISLMKDIRRVFMYHGAEHKSINCVEHGLPLTVENVRTQSKEHKRCGTSFLLTVMLVSIIFFIFIRVDSAWLRVLLRLILVPVIAGVSYEFIKLAGRSENPVITVLSKPGLWLQGLTTREPDDSMIECAIASVEAVFDWKKYQEESAVEEQQAREKKEKKAIKNAIKSGGRLVTAEKSETGLTKKTAAKPEDRPFDKTVAKSEDKPFEKTAAKPEDKPFEKTAAKPEDKPTEKVVAKPEDKPFEKIVAKPEDKLTEKVVAKSEDKLAEEPAEDYAQKAATEFAEEAVKEQQVKKAGRKSTKKQAEKATEKTEEKTEEKAEEKAEEKLEEKTEEKLEDKPAENAAEKTAKTRKTKKAQEKPEDKPADKPEEKLANKPEEKLEEKPDLKVTVAKTRKDDDELSSLDRILGAPKTSDYVYTETTMESVKPETEAKKEKKRPEIPANEPQAAYKNFDDDDDDDDEILRALDKFFVGKKD